MTRRIPRARFTGKLTGLALSRAFADADFFVFPSETDTFGNVVLQAMSSGLPVVVTDKMAPKEQVSHGIDGVVASNASEFGSAVDRLAREEGLRLRMGKAARAHAVQQSWGKVFDRLLKHDELAAELHQAKTPVVGRLAV